VNALELTVNPGIPAMHVKRFLEKLDAFPSYGYGAQLTVSVARLLVLSNGLINFLQVDVHLMQTHSVGDKNALLGKRVRILFDGWEINRAGIYDITRAHLRIIEGKQSGEAIVSISPTQETTVQIVTRK